jgi:hypothetical protein
MAAMKQELTASPQSSTASRPNRRRVAGGRSTYPASTPCSIRSETDDEALTKVIATVQGIFRVGGRQKIDSKKVKENRKLG